MSRYLLLPHSCSTKYFSLAVTSMRAELPSGKAPTTLVLLLVSRLWIGNTYLDDSGRDSPASLNSTGDM